MTDGDDFLLQVWSFTFHSSQPFLFLDLINLPLPAVLKFNTEDEDECVHGLLFLFCFHLTSRRYAYYPISLPAHIYMEYLINRYICVALEAVKGSGSEEVVIPKEIYIYPRKLWNAPVTEGDGVNKKGGVMPDRIGEGLGCSEESIFIDQGPSSPMDNGIPTYTVCDGCSISDLHVTCGAFTTAREVDPVVFRRLDIDDCLVNDGKPLNPGDVVSFQYADSFPFPLAVKSLSC